MSIKNIIFSIGLTMSLLLATPLQAMMISDHVHFLFGPNLDALKNKDIKGFLDENIAIDTSNNGSAVIDTSSQMKSLSRFDPSLGILTDVKIGWKSHWGLVGGSGAARFGEAKAKGTSGIEMKVKAIDPNGGTISESDSFQTKCGFIGLCGDIDFSTGEFNRVFNPVNLGDFIGLDPLDFLLTHNTLADLLKCKGKCATGSASKWYGKLFVKYTYRKHDVPEPSLLALFGLGLLGVSAASAFKRRRG